MEIEFGPAAGADMRIPERWVTDSPWLMELPADAVEVDLPIGPVSGLSGGIGSATPKKSVRKRRRHGCKTVTADPDPGNERAIRACRTAGFRQAERLEGRYDDAPIMQYEPNNDE